LKDNDSFKDFMIALREDVKGGAILEVKDRCLLRGIVRADEDPKIRRLAAQILGYANDYESLETILKAYLREETLYVRADYLKAISKMDYSPYIPRLKARLAEIEELDVTDDKKVHLLEEAKVLRELITKKEGVERHTFTGLKKEWEILLSTRPGMQQITYDQLQNIPRKKISLGVMVKATDIMPLWEIRTFDEMLFYMGRTVDMPLLVEILGLELKRLGVISFIRDTHKQRHPIGIRIAMPIHDALNKRGILQKRLGMELTNLSDGFLVNATTGYEVEIRLLNLANGGYHVFVKLFTIPKNRFHYRKETLPTSIKPTLAANLVRLAKPYMKEGAQIIDPFCGVGTMLIERRMQVRAGDTYGVDKYGKAIEMARINAQEVGPNIHFIHRDFNTFKHEYMFDELITNMPTQSKQVSRADVKACYEMLFRKARELLKIKGMMFVYGNEHGLMKQQLRLQHDFVLIREYLIDKRSDTHFYIIRYEER
jgi:16S rRNA G966 N2-methylase RsmD